ncbi:hypothetical protein F2Q70_00031476 [Brassica cretica]|uniref:NYN domain-containing protein n=1 Tax=Brassica cretica TaxID=69181 RepID=A0A8S9FBX1_BRACR|nr:hypothetical protein F2Q70_00031476 [Brassica cretica]
MRRPVPMFWDADNLSPMVDKSLIVGNVDAALKTYNPDFYLRSIFICASEARDYTGIETPECPVTYLRTPLRSLFCDACPNRRCFRPGEVGGNQDYFTRVKEFADRMIVQEMMSYAHDFPNQKQPMLLVTTDRDFRYSVKDLHDDRYLILTAVRSGYVEVPLVARNSVDHWLWEDMQNGRECVANYYC